MPRHLVVITLSLALVAACDGSEPTADVGDVDVPDAGDDSGTDGLDRDIADTVDPLDADDALAPETDSGGDDTDTSPVACSEPDAADLVAHAVGEWNVSVDPATGAWSVAAPHDHSTPVLRSGSRCDGERWLPLATAFEGTPNVQSAFGSFKVVLTPGRNISWISLDYPVSVEVGDGASVALVFDDETRLRFAAREDGNLEVALVGDGVDGGQIGAACAPTESFFGLGSQTVEMDLRGHTFPLWTQEQGIGKPDNGGIFGLNNIPEAAYAPMGIWHSTSGFSAITTSDGYQVLDLCDSRDEAWSIASYPTAPGFVLVAGESPRERLSAVTAIVGRPPVPPAWVFAPWNDAVGGPARLYHVAQLLRENHIPSSAIWSEDWIGGSESDTGFRLSYAWEWDPTHYPNLPADIDALHGAGFAFLAYFNTFVPADTRMFVEGEDGGFLVKNAEGETYTLTDPAFRNTGLVDLTNPDAFAWFGSYMRTAALDLGIDGWMADFTEWLPTDAVLASGESAWTYHNRWPLDFQRLNTSILNEVHDGDPRGANDWIYFARSGWASTQGGTSGLAPAIWAGDQDTDWEPDDGIPSVVPIGAHLGLSGVAVYGSDIAGYSAFVVPPTTKELFYRWTELGAFHPLMRTHHGSSECANWAFDRDEESLEHFKRYAQIHTVLYPVFSNLMAIASSSGLPIVRHPWLVASDSPEMWAAGVHEFFVGDDLLVAAVLAEGATTRSVVLPERGWWPLFGDSPLVDESANGASFSATVDAAITEVPVFVRPGTALPLLMWAPDSFYGATTEGVTDLDDVAGQRLFALYPDASGDCRPATDVETTVAATGLPGEPDWSTATIEGSPIDACDEVERTWPCFTSRGVEVAGSAIIAVGGGSVTVHAPDASITGVGVAGAAWSTLAVAPLSTDLASTATPWCERVTEGL